MSSDVNAKLYEKMLLQQAEGRALFHPAVGESAIAGGTVGDCGYIKGGEFVKLFSVFEPPAGLQVGTLVKPVIPAIKTEQRPNPNPCFKSSEFSSVAFDGGAGTTFASFPVDLSASIAYIKEESSFAFLAFSQQCHQRAQWFETRLLEDYLVDYGSIIRHYYSSYGIKGKLLIISGTIKTKGWCGGVASGISTSVNVQLQVDAAGQVLGNIGIAVTHSTTRPGPSDGVAAQCDDAVAQMDVQKAQKAQEEAQKALEKAQRSLTWALTSGPANTSPSSGQDTDAALFPYCVVVCPVTVRWRDEFRAMFRIPVKATYPRSFLPDVPEPGGPKSQGSTVPGSSSLPTASRAPDPWWKGITRMFRRHEEVHADPAAATDADDSDDDDDSDESTDDDGPPDLLSSILDSILDVRPDIELAVGAWTAITGYATMYGSLPVVEDCVKVIEPAINKHGELVAHLARIEPVPAHHVQSPQDLIRVPHLKMTSSHSTNLSNEISDISPEPIANGAISYIYRAKWKNHGNEQDVVLKVARESLLPKDSKNERLKVIPQVDVSKRLQHRNIVQSLGTCTFLGTLSAIVMPFYRHGVALDYIQRIDGEHNNKELRHSLMLQVMLGVEYLHAQGIVHGDIRAGNVFIADDGTPKLNVPPELGKHSGDHGSDEAGIRYNAPWMAPELFIETPELFIETPGEMLHSASSDIWACGCLFIEVESGQRPFHPRTRDFLVLAEILRGGHPPRPDNMPDAIWAIALQCFNLDPASRPSATEVAAQLRRLLSVRVV